MSTSISSWSWRHRFYAFLLRRALGPFLSKKSAADLHRSILDIDWLEGKLVLVDVELNPDHLNSLILASDSENSDGSLNLLIRRACIRRVEINMSLLDCVDRELFSSTTRTATTAILRNLFGNPSADGRENIMGVVLKVNVELDGLSFVLSPGRQHAQKKSQNQQQQESDIDLQNSASDHQEGDTMAAAHGFFSSLVDAAMKSLRLSINVSGVRIRTCSNYCLHSSGVNNTPSGMQEGEGYSGSSSSACWIDICVASARYYDLIESNLIGITEDHENISLSKALDFEGLAIDSNSIDSLIQSKSPQTILQSTGVCKIRFAVIEKCSSSQTSNEVKPLLFSARQTVQISFGQRIAVDVDPISLTRMVEILNTMKIRPDSEDFVDACESDPSDQTTQQEENDLAAHFGNEFYKETYDQIMKQYIEARHLARTRELRGGLLVPAQIDKEDLSFDTFFDANDHSATYCNSMTDCRKEDGHEEQRGEEPIDNVKDFEFVIAISEFTVKVNLVDDSTRCFRSIMRQDDVSDCILISVCDMSLVNCRRGGHSKMNFSVSHFEIESQMATTKGARAVNESMLRFDNCAVDEPIISTHACVSVIIESCEGKRGKDYTRRVDISLKPIEITHQERAVSALSDMIKSLSSPQHLSSESQQAVYRENGSLFISVRCPSIELLIASQNHSILQNSVNRLFQRHGYEVEESGGLFLGIGFELDNITSELSLRNISNGSSSNYDELKATLSSSHALLFAKSTELKRGRRRRQTYVSRRADLVAFTREEDRETNAMMVSFQQILHRNETQRHIQTIRTSAFPLVIPLSSVKAQQESDDSDDEFDIMFEAANRNDRVKVDGCQMNSSDPQYILSSEANEAEKELRVDISNIFFDFTVEERQSLSAILSSFGSENEQTTKKEKLVPNGKQFVGLSLNVEQISALLHGHDVNTDSFSLIIDKMQLHALTTHRGIRNLRLLFFDVTLYQLSNFHPTKTYPDKDKSSLSLAAEDRCERMKSRQIKTPDTVAKALFFRSKLCRSMSPETPSFLVDVLFRNGEALDEEYTEVGIHGVIYDMTYRYDMNSDWLTSLTTLVKCSDTENDATTNGIAVSLFNVSVSFADCNIDYTPPTDFKHGSRVIVKVGGVRFASNIAFPSASVQAFKLSLSDLRLYICNYRYPHNEENALLSCSHRFLNSDDLHMNGHAAHILSGNAVSWEDVLFRMNFVNLIVLDSLDSVILQSTSDSIDRRIRREEPALATALTLGHFSLYACHDSFSCFNETYNEWFIKFTSLSDEELDALRVFSEYYLEHDNSECRQSSRHESLHIDELSRNNNEKSFNPHATSILSRSRARDEDDVVAMDLTETLLFENYYTIDATSRDFSSYNCRQIDRMTATEPDEESQSSNDDWAAVEHDYAKFSGILPEDDQKAEWIVCKPDSVEEHTQKLKIFPQHIPVKHPLDPLAGSGALERAMVKKLAGTEIVPDIGLRVIVKDASVTVRLFDGFDFMNDPPKLSLKNVKREDRRDQLLSNLMGGEDVCSEPLITEECNDHLRRDRSRMKQHRNVNKYFEIVLHGIKLKQDSFVESKDHRLASLLDLSVSDFYIAEAISNDDPIKLMGEWMNEVEHPRDDSDGIIMLQIATKHPLLRVSADGKLMSDESRATLELLPLRCYLNQKALRFIRNFFAGNQSSDEKRGDESGAATNDNDAIDDDELINIFFNTFKVRPSKLKVDYIPERMDVESLRDGNYSEILNLCPLEDMILNLAAVENHDLTGWGSVFSELTGKWIEDICSTQAHKFFTRAAPVQLLSTLGDGVADLAMVIIVPEANASAYLKNIVGGTTSFAAKVAVEAISTSAKLTRFTANQLTSKALASSPLPSRPRYVPRNAGDTASHAYESMMRGLREANYNIITGTSCLIVVLEDTCVILTVIFVLIGIAVPYREYQQSGASGSALCAIRGIPIGIVAPIAGASEALSYTLLGIRNQLRPDKRREEENSFVARD